MSLKNNVTHILKRNGQVVIYDRNRITDAIYRAAASVGGHEKSLSEKLSLEIEGVINDCYEPPDMPLVEEIQDIMEKVLIERGHAKTAKALILYQEYRRRGRKKRIIHSEQQTTIPYRLMYETLVWNLDHDCETVEKLNQKVRNGRIVDLIRAADKTYDNSIHHAAETIATVKERLGLIIVAGPSSSGKTTTTAKLAARLKQLRIETVLLNLDHYFFDLKLHPKDEFGDYDFETPEALNIPLINEHLSALVNGDTVKIPHYDFKNGKRYDNVTEVALKPGQILLIDTLHGLYEPLTQSIASDRKFRVYIETISQLRDNSSRFVRWTDIRLLRRMVRDHAQRGYDPMRTIGHWHYVRRSELKHIIPMIHEVEYLLNGALSYELPFLKKYAFEYFPSFLTAWKGDHKRRDAYLRAERIYQLLNQIDQFDDISVLPRNSLLREFIGGSRYKLH